MTEQASACLEAPNGKRIFLRMPLSGYQKNPGTPVAVDSVLRRDQRLHIERRATKSWFVVSDIPPAVYCGSQIRGFWQQTGFRADRRFTATRGDADRLARIATRNSTRA